jgi:hypothetical protein
MAFSYLANTSSVLAGTKPTLALCWSVSGGYSLTPCGILSAPCMWPTGPWAPATWHRRAPLLLLPPGEGSPTTCPLSTLQGTVTTPPPCPNTFQPWVHQEHVACVPTPTRATLFWLLLREPVPPVDFELHKRGKHFPHSSHALYGAPQALLGAEDENHPGCQPSVWVKCQSRGSERAGEGREREVLPFREGSTWVKTEGQTAQPGDRVIVRGGSLTQIGSKERECLWNCRWCPLQWMATEWGCRLMPERVF